MALLGREFIAVPDDRKNQIVFKWPDHNIRKYTRAIVNADELAMFVNTGQVVGTMGPGRHQIDADEMPGLGAVIDWATGGNAYRAELYFVGTREYPGNTFGGRIDDVQDPQTGMIVTLRVFGDYSMQVKDPVALITNLVGTVDVANNEAITGWMSDQLLKVMRTHMTVQIVRNGWPILGPVGLHPRHRRRGDGQGQRAAGQLRRRHHPHGELRHQPVRAGRGPAEDARQGHRLLPPGRELPAVRGRRDGPRRRPGHGAGRRRRRRGLPGRRAGRRAARPPRPAATGPPPPPGPGFAGGGAGFAGPGRRRCRVPQLPRRQRGRGQVLRLVRHVAGPAGGGVPGCQAENPAGAKFCCLVRHPDGGCHPALHVVRGGDGAGRPLLPVVWHCGRGVRRRVRRQRPRTAGP